MLLGLWATWKWIPGQDHGPDGKVKTLEQWEVGRSTPNGFSQTRLARVVEKCWKSIAKVMDRIYLALDSLAGGDEKERRQQERERLRAIADEERELDEAERTENRGRTVDGDIPLREVNGPIGAGF